MKLRTQQTLSIFLLLFLCLNACKDKSQTDTSIKVTGEDIIGYWIVDIEAMKKAPEIRFNPLKRMGLELYKNMHVNIDIDTITAEITFRGEKKVESGKYKIISIQDNKIKVKGTSGKKKEKVTEITFLTRDKILFSDKQKNSSELIMVRKK